MDSRFSVWCESKEPNRGELAVWYGRYLPFFEPYKGGKKNIKLEATKCIETMIF